MDGTLRDREEEVKDIRRQTMERKLPRTSWIQLPASDVPKKNCRKILAILFFAHMFVSMHWSFEVTVCHAVREWEARAGRRIVRRAAFDVGSGTVKMTVADVDLHGGGSLPVVAQNVYSAKVLF
jgi:hypothetical protein